MGVRKILPNRRSVTGHVPSKKKPGLVAFESTLERDFIMLLEFDPAVRTIAEQPVRIVYDAGSYTPDLYVEFHDCDAQSLLIEVKYRDDLFDLWKELHPKLRAGTRYARKTGRGFKILTECEIRTTRLQNVKHLWRYRTLEVDRKLCHRILAALKSIGPTPIDKLLAAMRLEDAERNAAIPAIWHLIAIDMISADLDDRKLTLQSLIAMQQNDSGEA